MKSKLSLLVAGLALALITVVQAAGADVTGKWTAQVPGRNGQTREQTFTFKADGEKLTGNLTRGDQKTEIKEGSIKNGAVAFVVVRERNGQEFKTKYTGKLDGDTIKGFTIRDRNGQEQKREWTANRAK